MNPERPIPSVETSTSLNPELEQKRQEMLEIVSEAITGTAFNDQLNPNQREILTLNVTDAFIGLMKITGGLWNDLSIINEYYSTTNNRNLIVSNTDPSKPLFDLEEISRYEAFAGIKYRRRLVKNAFQNTLHMLQTNTTNYEACKKLNGQSKGNEFFGQLKRPQAWTLMDP